MIFPKRGLLYEGHDPDGGSRLVQPGLRPGALSHYELKMINTNDS